MWLLLGGVVLLALLQLPAYWTPDAAAFPTVFCPPCPPELARPAGSYAVTHDILGNASNAVWTVMLHDRLADGAGTPVAAARSLFLAAAVPCEVLGTAAPHITTYYHNKKAAISYTFDDGLQSQLDIAVPVMEAYGFRGTFNVIAGFTRDHDIDPQLHYTGGLVTGSWESWQRIAARGHEIGNHSFSHQDLTQVNDACVLEREIDGSAVLSTKKIGRRPLTFAFPFNRHNYRLDNLVLRNPAIIREHEAGFGNVLYTADEMNAAVDNAIRRGAWLSPMLHGFRPDEYAPLTAETFARHLRYVQSRASELWVDTYGNVSCYLRERDTATLTVPAHGGQRVSFILRCPLDNTIYHYPLTVAIPTGTPHPTRIKVLRGDAVLSLPTIVLEDGTILVDVVPGSDSVRVEWE